MNANISLPALILSIGPHGGGVCMCVRACTSVFCIHASGQMAQVQFTADSQLRLMYLEADCLQVAIKGVELPLLLDF